MEHYIEYVAMLVGYTDLAELLLHDYFMSELDDGPDPESTPAWSRAFENDRESFDEMELDDARYGTFQEQLEAGR